MTNEELTLWIEENHKFIRKKANFWVKNYPCLEMDYEEGYSLALEYVFRASLRFDESKGYKFITYAGMAIDNAFKCKIRSIQNQKKYIICEVSLDDTVTDSEGNSTSNGELIEDISINVEEETIIEAMICQIRNIAETQVKRGGIIFDLMVKGYTQREIGRELEISQAHCSRLVNKIIKLAKIELSKQNSLSGLQSEDFRL